jgi:hypothetical protein
MWRIIAEKIAGCQCLAMFTACLIWVCLSITKFMWKLMTNLANLGSMFAYFLLIGRFFSTYSCTAVKVQIGMKSFELETRVEVSKNEGTPNHPKLYFFRIETHAFLDKPF